MLDFHVWEYQTGVRMHLENLPVCVCVCVWEVRGCLWGSGEIQLWKQVKEGGGCEAIERHLVTWRCQWPWPLELMDMEGSREALCASAKPLTHTATPHASTSLRFLALLRQLELPCNCTMEVGGTDECQPPQVRILGHKLLLDMWELTVNYLTGTNTHFNNILPLLRSHVALTFVYVASCNKVCCQPSFIIGFRLAPYWREMKVAIDLCSYWFVYITWSYQCDWLDWGLWRAACRSSSVLMWRPLAFNQLTAKAEGKRKMSVKVLMCFCCNGSTYSIPQNII